MDTAHHITGDSCENTAHGMSANVVAAIGLGCYLGWQTVDISPTLFPVANDGASEVILACGYPYTALFVALLAVLGWWSGRRGGTGSRTWLVGVTATGTSFATALLYLGGWVADPANLAMVVVGRMLFFLSAGFVVLWGEILSRLKPGLVLACVALGYAVAFGICLVVADLGRTGALLLRTALPLLSGAALLVVRHDTQALWAASATDNTPLPLRQLLAGLPWRLFVGIGILGAIFTVTNHLSETKTATSTELYTLVAGLFVSLLILAVSPALRSRSHSFTFLYRLLAPIVIGALLLTLVLQPGNQHYEALVIGSGWVFFRIFTWTMWAHMGARSVGGGGLVFATGQIALAVCSTLAEIPCQAVNLADVPLVGAVAAIIFVAVVTSAFIMDEGLVASAFIARPPQELPKDDFDPEALGPDDVARAMSGYELSERECEIALFVLRKYDNPTICERACITESTLRTHLRNIYGKTEAHSRAELIAKLEQALRAG